MDPGNQGRADRTKPREQYAETPRARVMTRPGCSHGLTQELKFREEEDRARTEENAAIVARPYNARHIIRSSPARSQNVLRYSVPQCASVGPHLSIDISTHAVIDS